MEADFDRIKSLNYNQENRNYCAPERDLIVAMIERAILDLTKNQEFRRSARHWLTSKAKHTFSFLWCLEQLERKDLAVKIKNTFL